MTPLSALDILKHPQSGDNSDIKEAMQCAIAALEKQIPKKPFLVRFPKYGKFACICNATIKKGDKHCRDCGQALDWSDTE